MWVFFFGSFVFFFSLLCYPLGGETAIFAFDHYFELGLVPMTDCKGWRNYIIDAHKSHVNYLHTTILEETFQFTSKTPPPPRSPQCASVCSCGRITPLQFTLECCRCKCLLPFEAPTRGWIFHFAGLSLRRRYRHPGFHKSFPRPREWSVARQIVVLPRVCRCALMCTTVLKKVLLVIGLWAISQMLCDSGYV